ncbi:putative signal transduction protein with Nacht domain [Kribbella flavida DSM 17836]|uniref:Putative signal transduction protein with Nacht domain n=1 Tax=Kribbella flavida (strain DSM 17836 / JCM 10339 / NBRC 14399) TaxID=479435 RepID=D2PRQ7_KRIFD|nr:putative signal transduction protein with Nacht domain [Kribbella flavida DSM 17836]
MLRVALVVLTLSLTLVLLPIAINVGTGGTAPDFLAPYVGWTWPAIGVLWLVAIVTGLWELRSRRLGVTLTARSADQPRNRPNALARVDRYYAERVAGSLAARTRLALAVEESPEAVVRPYDLLVQPLHGEVHEVRQNADIAEVFDDLQDSMLILGAPGAGKTTLLLELARALAATAHQQADQPIPLLLDLSGWNGPIATRREDDDPGDSPLLAGFVRWLLDDLHSRYQIPPPVGRVWLRNGSLALLLDGVDEIAPAHRVKLTPVLEELQQRYLVGQLAVTCRIHDYELLPQPLKLYGAVRIRPLSRAQVLDYFASAGRELAGARAAIEQDDELWDLITSPLMLNVMALAYQGRDADEIAAGAVADHRRDLFDTYLSEVLARPRPASRQYDSRTAVRSLWCLAWWTRTRAGDRTAVPRWLTPNGWYGLPLPAVGYLAHMVCLPALFAGLVGGAALAVAALYGVLAGVAVGAMSLLLVHIRPRPWRVFRDGSGQPRLLVAVAMVATGAVAGFGWALAGALVFAALPGWLALAVLGATVAASYGVELILSEGHRRRLLLGLRLLVVVVGSWLVLTLFDHPSTFLACAAVGMIVAQGIRLVKALPMDHLVHQVNDEPRARDRMDLWVVGGLAAAVLVALALGADPVGSRVEAVLGIVAGVVTAKAWRRRPPLFAGPISRLMHGLLLRWTGYLPWRRRAFLRYAADRYVLTRTGRDEYAFIHLLVRDHLAECHPDTLAAKVERRIASRRRPR